MDSLYLVTMETANAESGKQETRYVYPNDPRYLDRQVWANSVDAHQTAARV